MSELRHDLSQFYPMKAVMEQLFGRKCFAKLKEGGSLADWKAESRRLLKAAEVAVRINVPVSDAEWHDEVNSILDLGRSHVASASTAGELFCAIAATFARMTFLQLGALPSRSTVASVSLAERNWRLDAYRSVQYVQTEKQRQSLNRSRKRAAKS
jgi:hypothetical protein